MSGSYRGSTIHGCGRTLAVVLGTAVIAAELVFGLNYPLFRDEFYFLACANHPAASYVDHPPLSIWILLGWQQLFGDSQLAVRFLPAVSGGVLVLLTARLARELGGGVLAQRVAALLAALAPAWLGTNGLYSMNTWDLLAWATASLLVARLLAGGAPRLWILLGLVAGLGLLNKWSLLFFLAGLGVALLATAPLRRQLRQKEPWIGLGVMVLVNVPQLAWQFAHGWPTLEFIHNATQYKNAALSPAELILGQLFEMGPASAPFWLAGLGWLLFARGGTFRALGLVYMVALVIIATQHGKTYYLVPAYAPLLAAGGVALEAVPRRWARLAAVALLVVLGLPITPFAIPVLPVERFVQYSEALGVKPIAMERSALGALPQHFADRFGWTELTQAVAEAYRALSPEDQRRVVLVADNYGEAAALDYYGRREGLPAAICQHRCGETSK